MAEIRLASHLESEKTGKEGSRTHTAPRGIFLEERVPPPPFLPRIKVSIMGNFKV
jgi:hypothetical protein